MHLEFFLVLSLLPGNSLASAWCMAVKCGHCRIAVLTELVLPGTTVLDMFLAVVGESVKPLQHVCNTLPISYIIDLRKLVFWRSLRRSENPVLRTLAYFNHNNFVGIASKYGFDNYMVNVNFAAWRNFCDSLL